jgi:hypothetical protein
MAAKKKNTDQAEGQNQENKKELAETEPAEKTGARGPSALSFPAAARTVRLVGRWSKPFALFVSGGPHHMDNTTNISTAGSTCTLIARAGQDGPHLHECHRA